MLSVNIFNNTANLYKSKNNSLITEANNNIIIIQKLLGKLFYEQVADRKRKTGLEHSNANETK